MCQTWEYLGIEFCKEDFCKVVEGIYFSSYNFAKETTQIKENGVIVITSL